ncbi:protease inhibitor I42 family protein [Chloroflexota bacterium]
MIKSKLLIGIVLLSLVSIGFSACASSTQPEVSNHWVWVEKQCEEFQNNKHISDSIEINAGDTLVVVLCSNPTTGFQWSEDAQISDTTVLKQEVHEFTGPSSDPPPPPGTPGLESWRFQTLKPGTSTIFIEYSRPWEGGEKGEWTFTLDVTVK